MNFESLLGIVHSPKQGEWTERNKEAFDELFGSERGRYPGAAKKDVALRAPAMSQDSGVPFVAYIHPSNPSSGPYSGLSFVMFPPADGACLVGLVIGTQGLSPDEAILGRPGHARKVQAITAWLNKEHGKGSRVAWAKQDPTRTDIVIPTEIKTEWSEHKAALDRYGKEVYALFRPTADRVATEQAVTAFLDLLFEERGHRPLAKWLAGAEEIRNKWFEHLMPTIERADVKDLLSSRRYVILQGPPGTGKTMMATDLLREDYDGRGQTIQFHPNTTYENFIGGLAPENSNGDSGLRFHPAAGALMNAAQNAQKDSRPYLLHIDEINRADLAKILGEAIFLLEFQSKDQRRVHLPYDFGEPFHSTFSLPENLHILGTMNSADRSIAIVDVAVRRRFAFVSLWPRMSVVEQHGCQMMQDAFQRLLSIFVEHATEDAFPLVPGHSYFLEKDEKRARKSLQVNLAPLLQEYLSQGYVGGFAEPIRSYLQWLQSL